MPIEIRPYTAADRDTIWRAITVVYGDGSPPEPDDDLPAERSHFVAMDDAVCVGFFSEFHFDTLRCGAALPTGGIAMVGVVPERRHTGLGGALMRYSLADMRRRGKVVAGLYPFAESFYRQFGYEVCGMRIKFETQKSYLPKFSPILTVRRLEPGEFNQIKPCYEAFATSRSGLTRRDDYLWDRLFGRKRKALTPEYERTVYAAGDPVEAYAVVAHAVDFHVEQSVSEFAWSSRRGYESMFVFMRSLAANKSGLTWYEPADSPFYYEHMASSPLCKSTLEKAVMYRILNVPAAFAALPAGQEVEFTLRVEDPEFPESVGPWRIRADKGTVNVESCDSADLEFDIRSFTQAFLGQPSIDDVLRNGHAEARCKAAADAFRSLMPPTPVYCLDMY